MFRRQQSGIALITVLLILSLATVAAVSMTTRQQLDIRRTTNILNIEQAYMALLATEEFVKRGLLEDASNLDGLGDFWNSPEVGTASQTIGEFTVTNFVIEDLQGRFNTNNLRAVSGTAVSQNNYTGFRTLLGLFDLPPELAAVAYDWIDTEHDPYTNEGAEDDAYSGLEKPYRTPDRYMASASEMFHLMGVNLPRKDDSDELNLKRRAIIWNMIHGTDPSEPKSPKVLIALPAATTPVITPINVNTVAHPAIYRLIVPGLSEDDAQALFDLTQGVAPLQAPPFGDVNAFWTDTRVQPLIASVPAANRMLISVNSEYFMFKAEAFSGNLVVYSYTILRRIGAGTAASVQVVHRSYGKAGEI